MAGSLHIFCVAAAYHEFHCASSVITLTVWQSSLTRLKRPFVMTTTHRISFGKCPSEIELGSRKLAISCGLTSTSCPPGPCNWIKWNASHNEVAARIISLIHGLDV